MNNPRVPGIPFDPREKGPFEVASDAASWTKRKVDENTLEFAALGVAVLGLLLWFKPEVPTLPTWVLVAGIASALSSGTAWSVGKGIAEALYSPNSVLLKEVNAMNGDTGLIEVSPDRFEELRVVNQNGKARDRDFLHLITVNGRRAYEVDRYHAEANVAVASWQAGVSNSEIRRNKSAIKKIKTTLEQEADKALEVMANNSSLLRKQASLVANRLIAVAEDVEVPNGGGLHEEMSSMLEEEDPAEALLDARSDGLEQVDGDDTDDVDEPVDDESEVVDVFDRAADLEATGAANVAATDGGEPRE